MPQARHRAPSRVLGTRWEPVSEQTFYRWKQKYGGLEVGDAQRLRALEDENSRLEGLVADQALDNQMLRGLLGTNW